MGIRHVNAFLPHADAVTLQGDPGGSSVHLARCEGLLHQLTDTAAAGMTRFLMLDNRPHEMRETTVLVSVHLLRREQSPVLFSTPCSRGLQGDFLG